jgi:dihydroorotase
MGPSIGNLFFHSQQELEETVKSYEGQCVSFHSEDPEILEANKNQPTHELKRPATAEISAIDFALLMIEKYNLTGKICHCSTKEGLEKIKGAKARGVKVTAEVSPHHLYFDSGMLTEKNYFYMQVNPPLRRKEDRLALIEALRNGTIDYLATDHAPHTEEEKLNGTSGTPQLDTYGLVTAWLIKEHNFTPEQIARVCSENPGKFISKFTSSKYGKIEEGYAGSLTIIDINQPTMVNREMLKTKCGWSAFEGITFPGNIVMTIIKGKIYPSRTKF